MNDVITNRLVVIKMESGFKTKDSDFFENNYLNSSLQNFLDFFNVCLSVSLRGTPFEQIYKRGENHAKEL